tara:strand:+ start:117 stop:314 length:198 start_codon:yes stop_codon:yes gene_type:complete
MSWQNKISEGLYRIAITLGVVTGLIAFLLFRQTGLLNAFLASAVTFGVTVGIVAVLNWIIRGFID